MLELLVNQRKFAGWTGVVVNRSLEQISGTFELQFTERFPGTTEKWRIRMGDACQVFMNGERVIKGFVDDIDITYSKNTHTLTVRGRDVTGDLVDCSHDGLPNEWKRTPLSSILTDLCRPFGIDVAIESDAGNEIEDFKTNEGDTVFDSIAGLCKSRSLLPISKADGKLTITNTRTIMADTSLVLGRNILGARFSQSNRDRYSQYKALGQGRGFDTKSLSDVSAPFGVATDELIERYRPLNMFITMLSDNGSLKKRADWESANRAGKSRNYSCVVQGWQQTKNGRLWTINELVKIQDSLAGLDATWLITKVKFTLNSEGGELAEITAMPPVAFQQITSSKETKTAAAKWESILSDT